MSSPGVQAKAKRAFPIDGNRHDDQMGERTHQFKGYLGAHTHSFVPCAPPAFEQDRHFRETQATHRMHVVAVHKQANTSMHHPDRGLITFALFLSLPYSARLTWKHIVLRSLSNDRIRKE